MEIETIGRVTVAAKIENLGDIALAHRGFLPTEQIRCVEVDDALVDMSATGLSMPKSLIRQSGLEPVRARTVVTRAGRSTVQVYGTARLTIQERDCVTDVTELPADCPVLIGRIPLLALDLVVDQNAGRLTGNPAHGGEHVIELY
jgi:hypothetical protein